MDHYDEETERLIAQAKENRLTNPRLVLEAARTLRDTAKARQDKALLGFADYSMANAYFTLNDADSVNHYAERALPNLSVSESWQLLGSTYNIMALMAVRTGEMSKALNLLLSAEKCVVEHHLNLLGAVVYMNIADLCLQMENLEEAMHHLQIAENFLDHCPEEELQPSYYAVASSEIANYAKRINNLELYEQQMAILEKILAVHPEFGDDINVLLLQYQQANEQKRIEEEEQLIEKIKTALFSTSEFLNYTNELMNFLIILKEVKRFDILDEVLEYIEQSLNGHESAGIMSMVSSFKISYYLDTGRRDDLSDELFKYWTYSTLYNHEANEAVIMLLKTHQDLEVSEQTNEKLKQLAETDGLTSLPNRRALNDHLDQLYELSFHKKYHLGVEMLDVDNFKHVNDTYGHSTGDDVLVLLGKCLKEIAREKVYAARYGGDEFIIVFDDLDDDTIQQINQQLRDSINRGIESASLPVFTISQGAMIQIPTEETRIWDYTSNADAALYVAKDQGKNRFVIVHSSAELKKMQAEVHHNACDKKDSETD